MEIEEFQESFKAKEYNLRPYIIVVSILLSIILVIMLVNNKVKSYYISSGTIKDSKLVFLIDNEELYKITSNKKIIIERNMFTYEVFKIDEFQANNKLYNEVMLIVTDLNSNLLIENNKINFKIITNENSIFEYLLKVVKGEWHIKEISKEELKEVNGGGLSALGIAGIIAGAIFVIGVIDGYVRPQKCND